MTKEGFHQLLAENLQVWLSERIDTNIKVANKVSLSTSGIDRVSSVLASVADNLTKHLHNSDGPDEHKIAWCLSIAVVKFNRDLFKFSDLSNVMQKKVIDDCALVMLASYLSIDLPEIEKNESLCDSLVSLVHNYNNNPDCNPFIMGSLIAFLLEKTYKI
jgi:hypothetical protein